MHGSSMVLGNVFVALQAAAAADSDGCAYICMCTVLTMDVIMA